MSNYEQTAARIALTLRRKGAPFVLEKLSGEYDSKTSDVLATPRRFTTSAVRVEFETSDQDGDSVRDGRIKMLVGAVTDDGKPMPEPKESDRFLFDDVYWTVTSCQPTKPATVAIVFEVTGRR